MHVLMVGVGPERVGGMWTVAENYLKDESFCEKTNLMYVATSTNGSVLKRLMFMIMGYLKILYILKTKDVDIVHVHMAEKGSVYRKGSIIKMAKFFHHKTIIHMHAGPFRAWYNIQSEKKQKKIIKILGNGDKILVLGKYWENQMSEIISPEKLEVLYNGVEVPENNPFNVDGQNIIYMGVMKKEKGIYDLLDAVKIIDDKLASNIQLLLCGNDLEGDILDRIADLGLSHRIKCLGWISGKEKDQIYQNAMLAVLPSYFEGLSMAVIEAMANGIPILTTNISTMPEVLGENCKLVNPGDVEALAESILELCSNKEKRDYISAMEYDRAKNKFSMEKNTQRLLDIYCELV